MGAEHRIAPRRRALKAGSISFGGGAIDCTVRNISDTGAALEVVTPLFIPDRFKLIVQSDNLNRPCHIVWRRGQAHRCDFRLNLTKTRRRDRRALFADSLGHWTASF
jgi:PilZ domain